MPIYSHSQLSVYEECPLKYKLQYRDKVKREEVEGIEGFMGNRVHEALKKCYDDLRYTRVNTLSDLLSFYNEAWQKKWHDDVIITKADLSAENYRALGSNLLENYCHRYAPFNQDLTIGTEMPFYFSLDGENKYRMRGFIDRLSRAKDGVYEIHDYKTSSILPTQEELDNDRQLALYHIGVQAKWPQVEYIRLVWHFLAFDTEMVSSRSEQAISMLRENTIKLVDEIEAAESFPARESFLCNWCQFPGYCPERKHVTLVENLPANEYLQEPGVALVNKYAALKDRERIIGEEINKVREAIIGYAQQNNMNVLRGNERLVRVRFYRKLKFPSKNDDWRQELDEIIINAGKWMEVSQLDTNVLGKLVENRAWGRDLIEKVMKYSRIEEIPTVSLSQLKEEKFID